MILSLSASDLLTRLTKEELDELTTTAIESGQADPVTKAIDGGLGEIKVHIDPGILEERSPELLYRIWLSLAVPLVYPRRAVVPEKHLKEQDWARQTLTRLNDGTIKKGSIETITRDTTSTDNVTRAKLNGL